jgi:hypothetical protein
MFMLLCLTEEHFVMLNETIESTGQSKKASKQANANYRTKLFYRTAQTMLCGEFDVNRPTSYGVSLKRYRNK